MSLAEPAELPYRAEYAKSGRAACKGCKQKIEKDHLRLAVMVQSPMFDGKVPHWYHYTCFFIKQRPRSIGDISHFESLRWEDQEKIKEKIDSAGPSTSKTENHSAKKKSSKRKSDVNNLINDFCVEYSKSSRAVCRGCEEKIIMKELRVSKKDFDSEDGRQFGGVDRWYHLDCFGKLRHELEFWDSGTKLPGFKSLRKEDQMKIKSILPEIKPIKKEEQDETPEKKPKLEDKSALKKQNETMFYYYDHLKTLPKKELELLLEYNDQQIPPGTDGMCDRLADIMTFGALLPCTVCGNGQFVFRSGVGYFCLGNKDEWVKCETVSEDPPRKPFKIPVELKKKYEFLTDYKYKPQKRIFEKHTPSASVIASSVKTSLNSIKSELAKSGPKIERHLPMKRMEFAIVGKLSKSNNEIKLEIMKLGGKVNNKIHDKTTAVISNEETVKKKAKGIATAEELNIQVVPESIIDECKNGTDAISCINRINMVPWGSDPSCRMTEEEVVQAKSKSLSSRYKSKAPTKQKLKIQNGHAVDPDSGLEDTAHVYRDHLNNVYNCVLSLTDLQGGKNSFYKLQILESESKTCYWLFRSWGRIGTTIGGNKCEAMSRQEAIYQFKSLFEERTANSWDNRKNFVKVPGKMVMVDISYEDEEDVVDGNADQSIVPSKLEKPVQDLVSLIFDVSTMKNIMKEMELDLEKMPLGKLSKKQIQNAFSVLTKLQDTIQAANGVDEKRIISFTNQFFTLIPHDFGIDNPPLLNDIEMIKQKVEMLDALMEIEIAYKMLKESAGTREKINPIDAHYVKLNTDLSVLNENSTEFKYIQLYLQNTHAETHRNYELEVVEVFKVNRHGEDKRFKPFKKLHNRKLLWHGSRLPNFAGILSQGLRIAPPEAPVTGYMFGKGIYFADMVSKSANYCMTSPTNNTGLLLLCEVALGEMHELNNAEFITKLPPGKHSVKGVGKTQPDPSMSKFIENVEVPLGKGVPTGCENSSLLYNEYIVYDVAQVKVQYLVQVKFHYKY